MTDELFTNAEREDIDHVLMYSVAYGDTELEARAKKAQAAINRAVTRTPHPDTAAVKAAVEAANALIEAAYKRHDEGPKYLKYVIPYKEFNALNDALRAIGKGKPE